MRGDARRIAASDRDPAAVSDRLRAGWRTPAGTMEEYGVARMERALQAVTLRKIAPVHAYLPGAAPRPAPPESAGPAAARPVRPAPWPACRRRSGVAVDDLAGAPFPSTWVVLGPVSATPRPPGLPVGRCGWPARTRGPAGRGGRGGHAGASGPCGRPVACPQRVQCGRPALPAQPLVASASGFSAPSTMPASPAALRQRLPVVGIRFA